MENLKYPIGIAGLLCLVVAVTAKDLEHRGTDTGNVFAYALYFGVLLLVFVLPVLIWQEHHWARDRRRRTGGRWPS